MNIHKTIYKYTIGIILLAFFVNAKAQDTSINIWANTECKANVKLTPYLAKGSDNIGIIVCPGGS